MLNTRHGSCDSWYDSFVTAYLDTGGGSQYTSRLVLSCEILLGTKRGVPLGPENISVQRIDNYVSNILLVGDFGFKQHHLGFILDS